MSLTLAGLLRALKVIQEGTFSQISLPTLVTFLEVAIKEGRTVVELTNAQGAVESTVSRQLLDLGLRRRSTKDAGFGLVEVRRDLQDMRLRRYQLTPAGRELLQDVLAAAGSARRAPRVR